MAELTFGYEDGETCWRNGCKGVIAVGENTDGCSCHISPPCGSCTTPREYCPECDWHATDDNDYVPRATEFPGLAVMVRAKPEPLDPRKIDWRSRSHSSSSMIKEGVYPDGASQTEVEAKVRGTFGGRFKSFGDGRFEYIAYTD